MNKSFRSLMAKFYTFAFFEDFILIYPLYTLLFSDKGLSISQITSLLVIWSATTFILEIPSGVIADMFSRRNVLILAQVVRGLGFATWLIIPSYWGFLVGFILWGAGSALTSGTKEALLYDELTKAKQPQHYTKITGRMKSLGLTGTILAGFIASTLAYRGYEIILICSIAAIATSAIALMLIPNAKPIESTKEIKYFTYLKKGIHEALTRPNVLLIVSFLSIFIGIAAIDEYFNLLLREKGFDNSTIAFWEAVIGMFGIFGSLTAHKLENKKLPFELILIIWGGLLIGAAMFRKMEVPLFIGTFVFIFSAVEVLFTARLQYAVSDKTRATTTSVSGFFSELVALAVFILIGGTAQFGGYHIGFIVLAVIIVIMAALLWVFARFLNHKYKIEKLGL